jgi:hypothetical protein
MSKIKIENLGTNYYIFGNKGNVWSNTAHAYKSGEGNLCGTPALSSNHAKLEGIIEVGCPKCLDRIYKENLI